MRKFLLTTALLSTLATPALAGQDQILGTGIGAALGGLLGSQIARGDARIATTAAGVFFGGLIGNNLGRSVNHSNNSYHHQRYAYAHPVTPTYYAPTYPTTVYVPNYVAPPAPPPQTIAYADDTYGSYCREYSQQVYIGNRVRESYGTACLQPDGSWRIVQP